MPVETRTVKSFPELVDETLKIVRALPSDRELWFRGCSSHNHRLLPRIFRDGHSPEVVFDREQRLLTRFRQRSLAYWPAGYSQSKWDHLFAMQHYGVPTRLLDWSENLFVAAHFALALQRDSAKAADRATIWCLDPIAWNRAVPPLSELGDTIGVLTTSDDEIAPYEPATSRKRSKTPVAIFGLHNSDRIIAQRGTFMVWGNDTRPLDEVAGELPAKVFKIEIEGDRQALSRELAGLGFSETMVLPELPSLAEELTRMVGWRSA